MKNKEPLLLRKAKDYAFLLLKFRLRSEKEIYQRLKSKKFDEEVIREVLAYLRAKGFVDDTIFAKAWIESRIKKPLGLRRLRQELKVKGISKEIIDGELEVIKKNYSEEEIVKSLAIDRLSKCKGVEPHKAKRRILDYLLRRGFSPEIVIDVINQL